MTHPCPECGLRRKVCPSHGGMCEVCCASAKAYFRAVGDVEVLAELDCRCEDAEDVQGVDLMAITELREFPS